MMMRLLLACLTLLSGLGQALADDGPTAGTGVLSIASPFRGRLHGNLALGAPDVGAVACPGTCAQHALFFAALETMVSGATELDVGLSITDAPNGSVSSGFRADQVPAGGALATFVQSKYGLSDATMAAIFAAAGATLTADGKIFAVPSNLNISGYGVTATGAATSVSAADLGVVAGLTPQMFGAKCDSTGRGGTGTDDTAALQAAINAAEATGRTLKIVSSHTMCRTTAPLTITAHLTIAGDGCQPYTHNDGVAATPGAGSWLYFNHAGKGIVIDAGSASQVSTVVAEKICTIRDQPAPVATGTWAPNANDFDLYFAQDDFVARDLMLLNPTKGLFVGGRGVIENVRGQPFQVGLQVDHAHDTTRVADVHWWPFWADNAAAEAYTRANLDAFLLARADNPHLSNLTAIYAHECVHLAQSSDGVTNKLHAVNLDCDLFGDNAIFADATTHATGQFVNVTGQGYDASSNAGIDVTGTGNFLTFANLRITLVGGPGVVIAGTSNTVSSTNTLIESWGAAGATPAVVASTSSAVAFLTGSLNVANGPPGSPATGGAGQVNRTVQAANGALSGYDDSGDVSASTSGAFARSHADRAQDAMNCRDFGCIFDARHHPLSSVTSAFLAAGGGAPVSTVGWTLAQWKVIYPSAIALSDEIDGLAVQRAYEVGAAQAAVMASGAAPGYFDPVVTVRMPAGKGYVSNPVSTCSASAHFEGVSSQATTLTFLAGSDGFRHCYGASSNVGTGITFAGLTLTTLGSGTEPFNVTLGHGNPGTTITMTDIVLRGDDNSYATQAWRTCGTFANGGGFIAHGFKCSGVFNAPLSSVGDGLVFLTNGFGNTDDGNFDLQFSDTNINGYQTCASFHSSTNKGYEGIVFHGLQCGVVNLCVHIFSDDGTYYNPQWFISDMECETAGGIIRTQGAANVHFHDNLVLINPKTAAVDPTLYDLFSLAQTADSEFHHNSIELLGGSHIHSIAALTTATNVRFEATNIHVDSGATIGSAGFNLPYGSGNTLNSEKGTVWRGWPSGTVKVYDGTLDPTNVFESAWQGGITHTQLVAMPHGNSDRPSILCTDCRKPGEAVGAGTGMRVNDIAGAWIDTAGNIATN